MQRHTLRVQPSTSSGTGLTQLTSTATYQLQLRLASHSSSGHFTDRSQLLPLSGQCTYAQEAIFCLFWVASAK
jgi:hypothetical protein